MNADLWSSGTQEDNEHRVVMVAALWEGSPSGSHCYEFITVTKCCAGGTQG